jgi:hypothetical protein
LPCHLPVRAAMRCGPVQRLTTEQFRRHAPPDSSWRMRWLRTPRQKRMSRD